MTAFHHPCSGSACPRVSLTVGFVNLLQLLQSEAYGWVGKQGIHGGSLQLSSAAPRRSLTSSCNCTILCRNIVDWDINIAEPWANLKRHCHSVWHRRLEHKKLLSRWYSVLWQGPSRECCWCCLWYCGLDSGRQLYQQRQTCCESNRRDLWKIQVTDGVLILAVRQNDVIFGECFADVAAANGWIMPTAAVRGW